MEGRRAVEEVLRVLSERKLEVVAVLMGFEEQLRAAVEAEEVLEYQRALIDLQKVAQQEEGEVVRATEWTLQRHCEPPALQYW